MLFLVDICRFPPMCRKFLHISFSPINNRTDYIDRLEIVDTSRPEMGCHCARGSSYRRQETCNIFDIFSVDLNRLPVSMEGVPPGFLCGINIRHVCNSHAEEWYRQSRRSWWPPGGRTRRGSGGRGVGRGRAHAGCQTPARRDPATRHSCTASGRATTLQRITTHYTSCEEYTPTYVRGVR